MNEIVEREREGELEGKLRTDWNHLNARAIVRENQLEENATWGDDKVNEKKESH